MKKILLVLSLVSIWGCSKDESRTCVCYDYGNGYQQVERRMEVSKSDCRSIQSQWLPTNPEVRCNLE